MIREQLKGDTDGAPGRPEALNLEPGPQEPLTAESPKGLLEQEGAVGLHLPSPHSVTSAWFCLVLFRFIWLHRGLWDRSLVCLIILIQLPSQLI